MAHPRPDQFDPTRALEATDAELEAQKNAAGKLEVGEAARAQEKAQATKKFAGEKLALTSDALFGQEGSLAQLQSPPLSKDQSEEVETRLQKIEADIPEVDDRTLKSAQKEVRDIAGNHLGLVNENLATDNADMDGSIDDSTNRVGAA